MAVITDDRFFKDFGKMDRGIESDKWITLNLKLKLNNFAKFERVLQKLSSELFLGPFEMLFF
jgi:hypothetical protein